MRTLNSWPTWHQHFGRVVEAEVSSKPNVQSTEMKPTRIQSLGVPL